MSYYLDRLALYEFLKLQQNPTINGFYFYIMFELMFHMKLNN